MHGVAGSPAVGRHSEDAALSPSCRWLYRSAFATLEGTAERSCVLSASKSQEVGEGVSYSRMERVDVEKVEEKRGQAVGHLIMSLQKFEEPEKKAEADLAYPPLRLFHTHYLLLFAPQTHC